jgi:hypothetical protein
MMENRTDKMIDMIRKVEWEYGYVSIDGVIREIEIRIW